MTRGFLTGALTVLLSFSAANAADITPSHVYQKTEVLRLTLVQQDLLDTQVYENTQDDTALRHPRHVMQKVGECHTILSKLLRERDIQSAPLPPLFSVREIRPSDVQNGVEHLLQEVQKLGAKSAPVVALKTGKVPGDVFNNLNRICRAVRAEITPADVFQVAVAVNTNLDTLTKARGYTIDIAYRPFEGKVPGDVYQQTGMFLEALRRLALNPDFSIPGGVIVPLDVPQGEIVPQDVIGLMNDALAETNAIKYTLGVREQTTLPAHQADKVPSDVYTQIERAHRVVKTLLLKEAEE